MSDPTVVVVTQLQPIQVAVTQPQVGAVVRSQTNVAAVEGVVSAAVKLVQPSATPVVVGGVGPAGAPGRDGNGSTYVFNQGTSALLWTVAHNLGKYPSVFVLDTAGDNVEGLVAYQDPNDLTITFTAPVSGTAYLN